MHESGHLANNYVASLATIFSKKSGDFVAMSIGYISVCICGVVNTYVHMSMLISKQECNHLCHYMQPKLL